jgi:hypothetical protein
VEERAVRVPTCECIGRMNPAEWYDGSSDSVWVVVVV